MLELTAWTNGPILLMYIHPKMTGEVFGFMDTIFSPYSGLIFLAILSTCDRITSRTKARMQMYIL
jgi:hypothetical protein